jgi:uncharacterized OsmC-like protein
VSVKLKQLITDTQDAYRTEPGSARVTFRSSSSLGEGMRSDVAIREHAFVIDEPPALGGEDAGPTPVEVVLAALGSCQEITYRAYATAMGIELDGVAVSVEGDIDLRGFFGVDDSVRAGYEQMRVVVNIESSASDEDIKRLQNAVNAHCPVLDMLVKPVPVDLKIAGRD